MPASIENQISLRNIVENISKSGSESTFHKNLRLDALNQFQSCQLPDRVSHLWKYSNPEWFEIGERQISPSTIKCFNYDESGYIKPIDLNDSAQRNLYGSLLKKNRLTYLNDVLCQGIFIKVPAGVKGKTLKYKFCSDLLNSYECARILIQVEPDADINVISEFSSNMTDNQCINAVVEIILGENAKLNYLTLNTNGNLTSYYLYQGVRLLENATFNNSVISIGGKVSKSEIYVELAGKAASTQIHGLVLGEGTQHFDHHTSVEHIEPNTKSELNFRVALKQMSRSAFTGNLKINHSAVHSDAHQENRNLLLSPKARAESIPELEILTNDVIRCNHGVTVGQVDKEQIYYLMSRGLEEKEAEKIIVEGFFEPTMSKIPNESLRQAISETINKKLGNTQ